MTFHIPRSVIVPVVGSIVGGLVVLAGWLMFSAKQADAYCYTGNAGESVCHDGVKWTRTPKNPPPPPPPPSDGGHYTNRANNNCGSGSGGTLNTYSEANGCGTTPDTGGGGCTGGTNGDSCVQGAENGNCINPADPDGAAVSVSDRSSCPKVYCTTNGWVAPKVNSENPEISDGYGGTKRNMVHTSTTRYLKDGCSSGGGGYSYRICLVSLGEEAYRKCAPTSVQPTPVTPTANRLPAALVSLRCDGSGMHGSIANAAFGDDNRRYYNNVWEYRSGGDSIDDVYQIRWKKYSGHPTRQWQLGPEIRPETSGADTKFTVEFTPANRVMVQVRFKARKHTPETISITDYDEVNRRSILPRVTHIALRSPWTEWSNWSEWSESVVSNSCPFSTTTVPSTPTSTTQPTTCEDFGEITVRTSNGFRCITPSTTTTTTTTVVPSEPPTAMAARVVCPHSETYTIWPPTVSGQVAQVRWRLVPPDWWIEYRSPPSWDDNPATWQYPWNDFDNHAELDRLDRAPRSTGVVEEYSWGRWSEWTDQRVRRSHSPIAHGPHPDPFQNNFQDWTIMWETRTRYVGADPDDPASWSEPVADSMVCTEPGIRRVPVA